MLKLFAFTLLLSYLILEIQFPVFVLTTPTFTRLIFVVHVIVPFSVYPSPFLIDVGAE